MITEELVHLSSSWREASVCRMGRSLPVAQPAPDQFDSHDLEDVSDDWVSLMLNDSSFDLGPDSSVPLASLASFPLPDFEDVEFTDLDVSRSIASACCHTKNTSSSACFDDILSSFEERESPGAEKQDMHFGSSQGSCRTSSNNCCPIVCQSATLPSESASDEGSVSAVCLQGASPYKDLCGEIRNGRNGVTESSRSPESGLTHVNCDFPDADVNIGIIEGDASGSEEGDLFSFVNDICTEGTDNTEFENVNSSIAPSMVRNCSDFATDVKEVRVDCALHKQAEMYSLLTPNRQEEFPCSFDNGVKVAAFDKVSRKRKALDRKSRSSSPEESAVDSVERFKDAMKGDLTDGVGEDDDEKRRARLMRNRESAQLSRQRKKIYVDELEEKIKTMASTIAELNNTINLISAENINLRRQLGVLCPPVGQQPGVLPVTAPWVGAYPGPAVGGRFMVPGSHVPLIPIPRWRSQQANVKQTKRTKSQPQEKTSEAKGSKKPKKVAGVAAIGFFIFMLLLLPMNLNFLGLKPIFREKDVSWAGYSDDVTMRAGGRVLTGITDGDNPRQDEPMMKWEPLGTGGSKIMESDLQTGRVPEDWQTLTGCNSRDADNSVRIEQAYESNGSMPLAAALFVPRNDRLVRIDGNLIIHSVLAGDKAVVESLNLHRGKEELKSKSVKTQETNHRGLAGDTNLKALAVKAATEEKEALVELKRVVAAKSRCDRDGRGIKALPEDGSLQQWFIKGLAGPVFSSGKCTEIFQFEASVSPSSTPAASHGHESNDTVKNSTETLQEHGPRRAGPWVSSSRKAVSYAVPLLPVGHKVMLDDNSKKSNATGSSERIEIDESLKNQKHPRSSMVVSVLAGSEWGEHGSLSGGSKGLPKVFVVVLIDGVKYVTYSCILPSTGSQPQFVMS